MTTPSEARLFMLSKVGREVILIGSHPKCGKRGTVDRVEEINGEPAMIVRLEDRKEYPVTSPEHVMFVIPLSVLGVAVITPPVPFDAHFVRSSETDGLLPSVAHLRAPNANTFTEK